VQAVVVIEATFSMIMNDDSRRRRRRRRRTSVKKQKVKSKNKKLRSSKNSKIQNYYVSQQYIDNVFSTCIFTDYEIIIQYCTNA